MQRGLRCLVVSLGIMMPGLAAGAETAALASPKLWNGWGMTPAGQIVPLNNLQTVAIHAAAANVPAPPMSSDLPLRLVVSPDGKLLLAACGGYNNTGLAVLSLAEKRVTKFFPLPEVFNGLAFSKDGRRVFVSGGDSGVLHVFQYQDGQLCAGKPARPATARGIFLAGIAVHPQTGKLYVSNEGNHEVWTIDPETLRREAAVAVGMHPHSCVLGADQRHLYVSNWGSRSVSVIDTQTGIRVHDISVGIRPNEMALSPDGRLFVACAGDNTVHVIQTRTLEKAEPAPAPIAASRKARGRSSPPRSIQPRRKAARPTRWPSHPTARHSTWPMRTTTTSWLSISETPTPRGSRASFRWAGIRRRWP